MCPLACRAIPCPLVALHPRLLPLSGLRGRREASSATCTCPTGGVRGLDQRGGGVASVGQMGMEILPLPPALAHVAGAPSPAGEIDRDECCAAIAAWNVLQADQDFWAGPHARPHILSPPLHSQPCVHGAAVVWCCVLDILSAMLYITQAIGAKVSLAACAPCAPCAPCAAHAPCCASCCASCTSATHAGHSRCRCCCPPAKPGCSSA